jgi:hypothetical protein
MPNEGEQVTRRDLDPNEIIRLVKERYRVCRYMFVVAAIWVCGGALLYFLWLGFGYQNTHIRLVSFVLQMVGYGTFSIAFAMQLALYRCPICDSFLARRLKDKIRCPRCNAQVRASA